LKILLLNQTFYPDVAATAQHLTDLALALTRAGHEVTVVTSRNAYDDPQKRFPRREIWQDIRIIRIGATSCGKSTKWRRAMDFASFLAACTVRLAFLARFDAVVALTSPPLISVLGALFARWRKTRFTYWLMDFNPDEAIAAGWLKPGSPTARLLERLSRFSLSAAHRVIALDRFMADRIAAKGVPRSRIATIPPWAHDDAVHFDPAARERFRHAHGMDGKFVVMYSGNHSPCHPLHTLLDAASRLASDPSIFFCFVGGGSEHRRIRDACVAGRLPNVLCLPYQPLAELAGSLSAADLHVVVMGDPFVGLVHPCKIYNILNVASPVLYLGPRPSHITEILDTLGHQHLWTAASHGDTGHLVTQIQWAKAQSPAMPRRIPPAAAHYSRANLLPGLVKEIVGN
jgi:glycosyltransferase involved in cell wall biosynthesis